MPKGVPIYGDEFRKMRGELYLTQQEISERLRVSINTIQRVEGSQIASVSIKTLRKFAEMVKSSVDGVMDRLKVEDGVVGAIAKESNKSEDEVSPLVDQGDGFENVYPLSERRLFEIPTFDLSVSAGPWSDVSQLGETNDPRSIDQGLFRVRLAGDCMVPVFEDGSIVEFEVIRPSNPEIIVGKHYYVQRDDGTATFKTLKKIDDGSLTLQAANKRKYPKTLIVDRSEIVRMAVAVARVEVL